VPSPASRGRCSASSRPGVDFSDRLARSVAEADDGIARRDLDARDPATVIAWCLWRKILGCAINDRAESVEAGAHRGARADRAKDAAGFGLSALLLLMHGRIRAFDRRGGRRIRSKGRQS